MSSYHELVESLNAGAQITQNITRHMQLVEAQQARDLEKCRTFGQPLIKLVGVITSIAPDSAGKGFRGEFRPQAGRLFGGFNYAFLQDTNEYEGIKYSDNEEGLSVFIETDSFALYRQDRDDATSLVCESSAVLEAQKSFLKWAGMVAPHRTEEITEALRNLPL